MSEATKSPERFSSLDELYRHCEQISRRNEEMWDEQIDEAAEKVFLHVGVTNSHDFLAKCAENDSSIAFTEPLVSTWFAGHELLVGGNQHERAISMVDSRGLIPGHDYNNWLPPQNVLLADTPGSQLSEYSQRNLTAVAWRASVGTNGVLASKLNHVGIWAHKLTDPGFGYATYRLYESLFGDVTHEAAPSVGGTSVLKLYLSLGFRPIAMHDPAANEVDDETGDMVTKISGVDPEQELLNVINGEKTGQSLAVFEFERQQQRLLLGFL